jgi:hypothetical protein
MGLGASCIEVCAWFQIEVFSLCFTVIHGCVILSPALLLQVNNDFGIISGDGESAFHRFNVICGVTISFLLI